MKALALIFMTSALSGCAMDDDNAKPIYGKTGLPVNCRAYVQTVVDGYRSKAYSAEDSMAGLERNCGIAGLAWKDFRE